MTELSQKPSRVVQRGSMAVKVLSFIATTWAVVLSHEAQLAGAQEYSSVFNITNTQDGGSCPSQQCYSLSRFITEVNNRNTNSTEHVKIQFSSGFHILNTPRWRVKYDTLTLTGTNSDGECNTESMPIIHCADIGNPIEITNVFSGENFTVNCLGFHNCYIYVLRTQHVTLSQVNLYESSLKITEINSVNINHILAYNSGLDVESIQNKCSILNGRFIQNQPTKELPGITIPRDSNFASGVRTLQVFSSSLDITDCDFQGALYSAIYSILSTIYFKGNLTFIGNTGIQGGAIALFGGSMELEDNTHLLFKNNHATDIGGAIFSSEEIIREFIYQTVSQPVFQTKTTRCAIRLPRSQDFSLKFINNSATNGGSATHGITLQNSACTSGIDFYDRSYLDKFIFEPDVYSSVTANPQRVCVCPDGTVPNCAVYESQEEEEGSILRPQVYPGQEISVSVAVVGFTFGTITSPVYAHLELPGQKTQFSSGLELAQTVQHTGCSKVNYTVLSDRSSETLYLSPFADLITDIFPEVTVKLALTDITYEQTNAPHRLTGRTYNNRAFLAEPLSITVHLLPCPLGFILTENRPKCDCEPQLSDNDLECNITTQTVRRSGTVWINASYSTDNRTIIHLNCPFGFCDPNPVDVNLEHPDSQCSNNRSGTLCGGCEPGLSATFGGSQCRECSNDYLALIIPFILAGFVLVFFIKLLDLTVSKGTIGGLVFFANIVGANQSIFFAEQEIFLTKIFNTFIAWINLDLGINTCFFDGLDAYVKTWLQFVFPIYIWLITFLMIVTAHYSTLATKLFGNNSVPTLATLLLLSYAKLLRIIITIFSFAVLDIPGGGKNLVWAFDGNIQYLRAKHAILFLAALLMVVFLWLPYTIILVLGYWPRRLSKHKGFKWMHNLQHFFDAYFAPFHMKHVRWVGFLLVIRVLLFIIFAAFFARENNTNLLLIVITALLLLMYNPVLGHVYKQKVHTWLEGSFFLNLAILSAGTLYVRQTNGNQEALIIISVGIVFIQFIVITVYHGYQYVVLPKLERRRIRMRDKKTVVCIENEVDWQNEPGVPPTIGEMEHSKTQVSYTVIEAPPRNQVPLTQIVKGRADSIPTDRGQNSPPRDTPLSDIETPRMPISISEYISKTQ